MSGSYGNDYSSSLCEPEEGIRVEAPVIDHIELPKNHNEDAIEDLPEHPGIAIEARDRQARKPYPIEGETSPMLLAKAAIKAQASNENRIIGYNMPIQHRSKPIHVDAPNGKEPHRAFRETNQVERPTRKNFLCVSPIRQAKAAIKINALHEVHTEPLQQDEKALRVEGPQPSQETIVDSPLPLENHQKEASNMKLKDKNNYNLPIALPAEVIDEPLMADIVDEEAQRAAATKLLHRRIGIVSLVFLAVLAAVLGGFCGSGKCQKSSEPMTVHDTTSTASTEECRFLVEPDFNLVTTTYRQYRPLDSPFFTACEPLNGESFTEKNTCRTYFHQTCQEPPYRIRMIFSGGGCNQGFRTDGLDFTCQDGPSGGPSHEIGYEAFITVSDVRKEDVVYFEDYVAVGEAFTLSNRGDDVGPDLLIRVYSSSNTEDPKALLQNIYYYNICTSTHDTEPFHIIGSVQLFGFNFGSQTIRFDSTTVKLEFLLYLDGSNTLLQNNRTIAVDQVSLISSFTDPIVKKELNVKLTRNADEATSKVEIALFDYPITWSQNKSNGRFSLRADVQGTGPDGQPCSGIGTLNFVADYI